MLGVVVSHQAVAAGPLDARAVARLAPYIPRPLAPEVAARVVRDALHYALSLRCAPVDAAGVQAYLEEVMERVDVILAPFQDHADIIETGEAIKRSFRAYAFAEAGHLFNACPV